MKIVARCHPLMEPVLPKPVMAQSVLPEWLKSMPSQAKSKALAGESIRTLKHCPPFIDALSYGLMILLPTDIHIKGGALSWDWAPPIIDDAPITRSPIGVHVPEQAAGAPIETSGNLIIKFTNFWTFETPENVSLLFTHPFNRFDLPFQTLTGMVDCDGFSHGYVHFPALLKPDFEGTIAKGTPITQIIPVQREAIDLNVSAMGPQALAKAVMVQESLAADSGAYRKRFRRTKD